VASFVRAMRSRDTRDLTADIETGVKSASLCHLANISYRTGRKLEIDAGRGEFVGDAEANKLLGREYRSPYTVLSFARSS
jgi:hypothetical protein